MLVTGQQLSKAQEENKKLLADRQEINKVLDQVRADLAGKFSYHPYLGNLLTTLMLKVLHLARDQKITDLEKLTSNQQRFVDALKVEKESLSKLVEDQKTEITRLQEELKGTEAKIEEAKNVSKSFKCKLASKPLTSSFCLILLLIILTNNYYLQLYLTPLGKQ